MSFDKEAVFFLLAFLGILLFAGIIFFVLYKISQRKKKIIALASQLNMEYLLTDPVILNQILGCRMFYTGRSQRVKNVLRGKSGGWALSIFDASWVTGSGKNTSSNYCTAVLISDTRIKAPDFTMVPENIFDKIAGLFGAADIDFEEYPLFSKKYKLKGSDENAVRTFFKDHVLTYFEQNPGWCVEKFNDNTLIYRPQLLVPVAKMEERIQKAVEICEVLAGKKILY